MRKIPEKKRRAPNYSIREKSLLLEIIVDFTNIIENKKTDSKSCQEKADAWDRITKVFNFRSTDNIRRNKESLRKYYENLKGTVKKQMLEDKRQIMNTREGESEEMDDDNCKEMILGMINQKTVDSQSIGGNDDEFSPESPSNSDSLDENEPDNLKRSYALQLDVDSEDEENKVDSEDEETIPVTVSYNGYKRINTPQLRRPDIAYIDQKRKLNMDYSELAKLKMSLYKEEIENIQRRNIREEEIHQLKKRKLLLEIKKAELDIKKITE